MIKAIPASDALPARGRLSRAKTSVPAAGGGRILRARNAAFITALRSLRAQRRYKEYDHGPVSDKGSLDDPGSYSERDRDLRGRGESLQAGRDQGGAV